MADDNLEWVFDSLLEFLKGPVWNIPVLTFIEQRSVVFEPGAENDEELRKIHENYKNLVDFMLGSYMEDIEITPEQFEKACWVASKKALTQFHQNLFEQVWAADDFEIFRRMMTQKNLELQLQALEVLAKKHGLSPEFMDPAITPTKEEENIMKEIIRQSLKEQETEENANGEADKETAAAALVEKERLETERLKEKELMDKALVLSLKEPLQTKQETQKTEDPPTPATSPDENVVLLRNPELLAQTNGEKVEEEDGFNTIPKCVSPNLTTVVTEDVPSVEKAEEEEEEEDEEKEEEEKINFPSCEPLCSVPNENSMDNKKTDRPWSEGGETTYTKPQNEVTPVEMQRRQEYLRQQRDRLLAMKRQERAKHLDNYEVANREKRPKSARAARKILKEETDPVDENVDSQTLAFRKSLANRLRNEVVDKIM